MTEKILIRKKCKCGRSLIVENTKITKHIHVKTPVCSTCQTYGLEESKRLYALEDAEFRRKSDKTTFEINGEKYIPIKTKC
jgi:hypothetical protein